MIFFRKSLTWSVISYCFHDVMVCAEDLSFIDYLFEAMHHLYGSIDSTVANILAGIASVLIDNGTIMPPVLTMAPDISQC